MPAAGSWGAPANLATLARFRLSISVTIPLPEARISRVNDAVLGSLNPP